MRCSQKIKKKCEKCSEEIEENTSYLTAKILLNFCLIFLLWLTVLVWGFRQNSGFASCLHSCRLLKLCKRILRRRQWHPTPALLPGKSHGRRSLEGRSPWGRWGSDLTEQLHFHFSHTGEGNGNPLQCSCLENPRDGGAWWAAVYGVAQSRTRLKRLSSNSTGPTLHTYFPLTPC